MSPQDVFGIAVRTIGLSSIVWGIQHVPYIWSRENHDVSMEYVVATVFWLGTGAILFWTADGIARSAYPRTEESSE